PRRFPGHYENAGFRLSPTVLKTVSVVGAVVTLVFLLIVSLRTPIIPVILGTWFAVGYVYYRYRISNNDALHDAMKVLDEHEERFTSRDGVKADD
ncbi:MAG: amino acid permease, partial [Halobacteria archaeon]|nr:amino acid permease [Halobacteria archaeon]